MEKEEMLGLTLRKRFRGKRLRGTAIELSDWSWRTCRLAPRPKHQLPFCAISLRLRICKTCNYCGVLDYFLKTITSAPFMTGDEV